MQTHRLWRDQFRAFRMWILERPRGRAGPSAPHEAPDPGVETVFLDRHAKRDWLRSHAADGDWDQFQVALAHEHDLVLARRGGETLGWAWIGYEKVRLSPLGRAIFLPEGCAYLYDAYVRPAVRGQGIGGALVRARCERADALGTSRLVTHVLSGNVPSLRALRANGFETLGRTVFVRALALRMWMREPLPPSRSGLVQSRPSV